ncbi:hypothetical protein [Paracoccus denitrificans]|uniref:hypothetical protein n=1 Tax=Paracoccus denitrificans TaxID=266 RepID=UPI001319EF2C|nr:hypothetical protein [Paracoccus denitrificans]
MQHEAMRHPVPSPGSDNVGDVLASIRRLIAQDGTGCRIQNPALNGRLPEQDGPPAAPIKLVQPARPPSSTRITPLVLDNSTLVAPDPVPRIEAVGRGETSAELHSTEPGRLDAWPPVPPDKGAAIGATHADRANMAEPSAGSSGPSLFSDIDPGPTQSSSPAPTAATPQLEETMLHANASATPINPAAAARAAEAIACDNGEPRLFAPQDQDAPKGTHLRGMIREAIRQELQGEIGDRLSRNLQQMIRHEIEMALRQMCERD